MPERRIATVLMLDVVGSTNIAAEIGDVRYRELSSRFARIVRSALKRFGGREEDHAGDGFFATFPQPDRAIRSALALAEEVRSLGIEIRCGIHTGQTETQDGKTQGIAVVIGARVMSLAGPGEVLVTSTTKELATGSDLGFEDFSAHELKGVPGTWQVFAVTTVGGEKRARPLPAEEAAERLAAIHPSDERQGPRAPGVIAAGIALVAVIAAIAFAVRTTTVPRGTGPTTVPASESILQLDQSGRILSRIEAPVHQGGRPDLPPSTSVHPMVVGQGGVWTLRSYRWLYHVDPRTRAVRAEIGLNLGGSSFSKNVSAGASKIWVAYGGGLIEINPATDEQHQVIDIAPIASNTADVTTGDGAIWMGTGGGRLLRFDPATGRGAWSTLPDPIDAIAFAHGSLWTADSFGATISRYDPDTMLREAEIDVTGGVDNIVAGGTAVWVLSRSLGTVTEVDLDSNTAPWVVPVGEAPTGFAAGSGAIWVGDEDGVIRRIDEDTREVSEIPFGAEVRALAFDDESDTLWVDVA
jgi:class 3 adenylate cyclase/streptogramin lyase